MILLLHGILDRQNCYEMRKASRGLGGDQRFA
jgi:hypothetical protein